MELKKRLQRVLQILDSVEEVSALSAIEKDMVLNELREAYSAVRFDSNETCTAEPQMPLCGVVASEESCEKEVEVEIIFDEEETEPEVEPEVAAEPEVEAEPEAVAEPEVEAEVEAEPQPTVAMPLYEVGATQVVAEQFSEGLSVADSIPCQKGVAECAQVASLRGAIGLADKFLLISELFDGDVDAYEEAIDVLDQQSSFEDCVVYISENYVWNSQSEATQIVMSLLHRRFNE